MIDTTKSTIAENAVGQEIRRVLPVVNGLANSTELESMVRDRLETRLSVFRNELASIKTDINGAGAEIAKIARSTSGMKKERAEQIQLMKEAYGLLRGMDGKLEELADEQAEIEDELTELREDVASAIQHAYSKLGKVTGTHQSGQSSDDAGSAISIQVEWPTMAL